MSDHPDVFEHWIERDLSAAARRGELAEAFEVDDLIQNLADLLAGGRRPVLIGASGVGKTAAIHELVRRAESGEWAAILGGRTVYQISIQHRFSSLNDPRRWGPEAQKLIDALLRCDQQVIPFFSDFHFGLERGLGPQMQRLALRFKNPILAEGNGAVLEGLFENMPELEEQYVLVRVPEPGPEQVLRILRAWNRSLSARGICFTEDALPQILNLTHRFLARSCQPRKTLGLLQHLADLIEGPRTVTASEVIDRFCAAHKVPRALADPRIPLDLEQVERHFSRQLLGQGEAVRAVVDMIGVIKAGLSDLRRPFGVFLFVGPSGVGKTHLAQLLASYLFGASERMIRLNMADFQNIGDGLLLFGNPDALNSHQIRGQLTQKLMGHPFAVLLLDEFEKAHEKIHDRFLQLIDEGCFINGAAETVSCRSTIIIATTNTGAELYRGHTFGFRSPADTVSLDNEVDRLLEGRFRFEFLNRFDHIVHFHPLSRADIRTIALRELENLKQRCGVHSRKLDLEVDDAVLDWLSVHGYDADHGARFLRRTIERNVTTALADAIVRHDPAPATRLALTVRGRRIAVRRVDQPAALPAATATVKLPLGTTDQTRQLDWSSLSAVARGLHTKAQELLHTLTEKKDQRSALIARMNEPDFWQHREQRVSALERFRELDVAVQVEGRLARSILSAAEMAASEQSGTGGIKQLARAVEEAASALRSWQERVAEEGPSAAWLVVGSADPLRLAGRWIRDVVAMELAWCHRLHLSARVVAYELLEDELLRVVLDVEGPGTARFLAMEHGIHRLQQRRVPALRARVEVLPKGPAPSQPWPGLKTVAYGPGLFGFEPDCRGRLDLRDRGTTIELLGFGEATLGHVLADLARTWGSAHEHVLEDVRAYGEDGCGARDLRTGVIMPRLRDVLRGQLDRFMEAWRDRIAAVP